MLRVAVVQLAATNDRDANTDMMWTAVARAAAEGARVVLLPEYSQAWAPRLHVDLAAGYLEYEVEVASAAVKHQVWIVAGALRPCGDRLHNVSMVYGPDGHEHNSYTKVHLFDAFGVRESDVLDAGDPSAVVVDIEGWTFGIATCYDLRFPEQFRVLADAGAQVFAVGAAWAAGLGKVDQLQVLARARALENTSYLLLASQNGPGRSGHSAVIDPLGAVLEHVGSESTVLVADLDPDRLNQVREQVPSLQHRRYQVLPKD